VKFCTFLVVFESARIVLVDLERHSALVVFVVGAFVVGVVEQLRLLGRGLGGAFQLALDSFGVLLLLGACHCWCGG